MATVNCVQPDSASLNRLCNGLTEEVLVRVLDIADITRKKGSAAAAADVVQVFSVAAGDLITVPLLNDSSALIENERVLE